MNLEGSDRTTTKSNEVAPSWKAIALGLLVVYTVLVFFSVGSLVCYHARLVAINETTNENIRSVYLSMENPHDAGCCTNYYRFLRNPKPPSLVLQLDSQGGLVPGGDGGDGDDDANSDDRLVGDDDDGPAIELV